MTLEIFALSGFINSIISFLLGFLVFKKDSRNQVYRSFFVMCLSVTVWGVGYGFWLISNRLEAVQLWMHVLNLGSAFIPIFYFRWILAVLNQTEEKRKILNIGYILTTCFVFLSFTPFYILNYGQKGLFPYWPNGSIFYLLYILFFVGLFLYSFWLQIKTYPTLHGTDRMQLRNVLAGSVIGFLGGLSNFPMWFNIYFLPFGNLFVFVYGLFFAHSIIRYRLMNVRIIFRKSLINISLVVIVLGITAYLLLFIEQFSKKFFEIPHNISTAFVAIIIGFSFPLIQRAVKGIVDRFIDQDLDFGFVTDLMKDSVVNSDQVCSIAFETAKEIEKNLSVDQITLLVRDHRFQTFVSEYPEQFKIRIPNDHDFINFVSCVDRVFETAQLEKFASFKSGLGKNQIKKFVQILKRHKAALLAPIIGEGGTVGIVFVPFKCTGAPFEKEEKQWLGNYLREVEEKLTPALHAQDFQAFSKASLQSFNLRNKVGYDG